VLDLRRLEGGIVPHIELPKLEESALEDVRCHECEDLVA
jgi:hypothetical protein